MILDCFVGGKAELKTVEGDELTAMMAPNDQGITLTDEKGNVAQITIPDVKQSNGEIHVMNKVLLP